MICSKLMSNKFDFNKVTFKTYVHQTVLNIWRQKLKKISKSTASQQGQLQLPPQLQGTAQDTTSGSTSQPTSPTFHRQNLGQNQHLQSSTGRAQDTTSGSTSQPTCHRQSPGQNQRFDLTTNISRGSDAEHRS